MWPDVNVDWDKETIELAFPERYAFDSLQGGEIPMRVNIKRSEHHRFLMVNKTMFRRGLIVGSTYIHPNYEGELSIFVRNITAHMVEVDKGEIFAHIVTVKNMPDA